MNMINIYSYCDVVSFRIILPYLTKFGFQILPDPFNQDFSSESRYPHYIILCLVNCMRWFLQFHTAIISKHLQKIQDTALTPVLTDGELPLN